MAELQTHSWTFAGHGIHTHDVTGVKSFRGWNLLPVMTSEKRDSANSRNSSVFPLGGPDSGAALDRQTEQTMWMKEN